MFDKDDEKSDDEDSKNKDFDPTDYGNSPRQFSSSPTSISAPPPSAIYVKIMLDDSYHRRTYFCRAYNNEKTPPSTFPCLSISDIEEFEMLSKLNTIRAFGSEEFDVLAPEPSQASRPSPQPHVLLKPPGPSWTDKARRDARKRSENLNADDPDSDECAEMIRAKRMQTMMNIGRGPCFW